MNDRILATRWSWLLVLGLLITGLIALSWQLTNWQTTANDGALLVHVLDVGQGSATLVETPDGTQILIDGGAGVSVLRALARELPWYDRSLDMIIASHPDTDHIGGLIDVLGRYQVDHVLWNGQRGDSAVAAAFQTAVEEEVGAHVAVAGAAQRWRVGASTTIEIYAPIHRPQHITTNAGSIVLRIVHGETSVLLPGDIPQAVERYLVEQYGTQLQSTILQLGHHGSDTSTAEQFLATVSPEVAIVSASADNPYGHPAAAVVARVQQYGIPLLQTADAGTITLRSNGTKIWQQ